MDYKSIGLRPQGFDSPRCRCVAGPCSTIATRDLTKGCGVTDNSRSESGWCPDGTSTPGAWRHAGVRFLLSGVGYCKHTRAHTIGKCTCPTWRFDSPAIKRRLCTHNAPGLTSIWRPARDLGHETRQNKRTLQEPNAHAGSRTRVTSMEGLYDAATLRALALAKSAAIETCKNNTHTNTSGQFSKRLAADKRCHCETRAHNTNLTRPAGNAIGCCLCFNLRLQHLKILLLHR